MSSIRSQVIQWLQTSAARRFKGNFLRANCRNDANENYARRYTVKCGSCIALWSGNDKQTKKISKCQVTFYWWKWSEIGWCFSLPLAKKKPAFSFFDGLTHTRVVNELLKKASSLSFDKIDTIVISQCTTSKTNQLKLSIWRFPDCVIVHASTTVTAISCQLHDIPHKID